MGNRSVTQNGIDIGSAYICWARGFPGEKVIANVGIQPLSPDTLDYFSAVKEGLAELAKAVKITRQDALIAIPSDYAVIKKITMDLEEEHPDEVIAWELSQQLTEPVEDLVYDWQDLTAPAGEKVVLLGGYQKKILEKTRKICRNAKVNPIAVHIDLFALVNLFEINYPERSGDAVALVLVDTSRTKIALIHNFEIVDIEFFEHAADMKSIDGYAIALGAAVRRLAEYNSLGNLPVYLAGAGLLQDGVALSIIDAFPGTAVLEPFRNVTCNVSMTEEELRKYSPQLAVAVGLALTKFD